MSDGQIYCQACGVVRCGTRAFFLDAKTPLVVCWPCLDKEWDRNRCEAPELRSRRPPAVGGDKPGRPVPVDGPKVLRGPTFSRGEKSVWWLFVATLTALLSAAIIERIMRGPTPCADYVTDHRCYARHTMVIRDGVAMCVCKETKERD